ncbi:MAG: transposase [Lewinellaceae bacterium]|nr:transposase [Lewinellaceae bacterium]
MGHREGISRAEPIRLNLEEHIAQDNPVRLIDAYVDSLDLKELGFSHVVPAETGSPPYHPGDLLKLYIYGYLHRMRSSRQLVLGLRGEYRIVVVVKGAEYPGGR